MSTVFTPHGNSLVSDDTLRLERSALETSVAVLQRQRRMEQQLQKAKADLEVLTAEQARSLALLHATLEASPDGVAAISPAGDLIAYNSSFLQLWGLAPELLTAGGADALWRHCAAQVKAPVPHDAAALWGRPGVRDETLFHDGRVFERHVSELVLAGDQPVFVAHWRDVTERKRSEKQQHRMARMLDRSLNEIYLFDQETLRFTYANAGALANLGYDLETLQQMRTPDIKPNFTEATFRQHVQPLIDGGTELLSYETVHQRADGSHYDVEVYLQRDTTDERPLFMALILDITERKIAQAQVQRLAFSDHLTGLPNRRMLLDQLDKAMATCLRHHRRGGLLFVDLDDFKTLNDTLGHDRGDLLLQQVARRLRSCVRESDTVARLGGDEFVVMLEDLDAADLSAGAEAQCVAEKILAVLNQPYQLADRKYHGTPSIGITLFGARPETLEEPLKRADMAMYQAKAAGRNTLCFFDPQMQSTLTARAALESDMRDAMANGEYRLHYQPQVGGQDLIMGSEALLRWTHPVRGPVSPADFIPLAEQSGLIVPLGLWVLETACLQLRRWAELPHMARLTVSVNVSPRQFKQADFVPQVQAVLARTGADPFLLKLELTENLLVSNIDDVIGKMNALKDIGVGFSLDDFGTGYSSLTYLKKLPLDQLKIDQGFVKDLLTDPDDAAIACTVIALAASLGVAVIAEGVETEAQRRFLADNGCESYQGYLFSRPLPAAELEALAERAGPARTGG
ncbi:MAG: domain S-box protein [Rhodoferax sp.]|nr:domain S-box protein [Rhodoferax sp.]